jgi:hypothetical protein
MISILAADIIPAAFLLLFFFFFTGGAVLLTRRCTCKDGPDTHTHTLLLEFYVRGK